MALLTTIITHEKNTAPRNNNNNNNNKPALSAKNWLSSVGCQREHRCRVTHVSHSPCYTREPQSVLENSNIATDRAIHNNKLGTVVFDETSKKHTQQMQQFPTATQPSQQRHREPPEVHRLQSRAYKYVTTERGIYCTILWYPQTVLSHINCTTAWSCLVSARLCVFQCRKQQYWMHAV